MKQLDSFMQRFQESLKNVQEEYAGYRLKAEEEKRELKSWGDKLQEELEKSKQGSGGFELEREEFLDRGRKMEKIINRQERKLKEYMC